MALFQETVPKWLFDEVKKERDEWIEKYHALRLIGHAPPAKVTQVDPKPDSGSQALAGLERAMRDPHIAEAALKLQKEHGLSPSESFREATKMRDIINGKADAPTMGGGNIF